MYGKKFNNIKIFIDSDVIISSLLSSTGASYQLLHYFKDIDKYISIYSKQELLIVIERMKIDQYKFQELLENSIKVIDIEESIKDIKINYNKYTLDENDAHIVAGNRLSSVNFLVSYNTKHFREEQIKRDFNIIVITPGIFIQYLRSMNNKR